MALTVNEEQLVLTFDADTLLQLVGIRKVAFTVTRGAQRFSVEVEANTVNVLPGNNVTIHYNRADGSRRLVALKGTREIISPRAHETLAVHANARTKANARRQA